MKKNIKHSKIYQYIVDIIEEAPLPRGEIIVRCLKLVGLNDAEIGDTTSGSTQNFLRSRIGEVLGEMCAIGLISFDEQGKYYLASDKPVIIRVEKCESEILKALGETNMTKSELRHRLKAVFGTEKTRTTRDDDILSTYMGQILKRLLAGGYIILENGEYALSPKVSARVDDLNALMTLRSDFLARLHSKGGEFFENYFMTLLKKYTKKHGKRVLESYVTGGTKDGGIDGVMKTEDELGFKETTMVQTKNRLDIASETDIRGFYGAVCAKRGTRGIYATTSTFHDGALEFLSELDDCIGVDGDRIFKMAVECSYGIKKNGGALEIDGRVI